MGKEYIPGSSVSRLVWRSSKFTDGKKSNELGTFVSLCSAFGATELKLNLDVLLMDGCFVCVSCRELGAFERWEVYGLEWLSYANLEESVNHGQTKCSGE